MWKNENGPIDTFSTTISSNTLLDSSSSKTFDNLSSLSTSASNPTLVSLVQSIMAEPPANLLPLQSDDDETDTNANVLLIPPITSDANDVSSTHDDEKPLPSSATVPPVVESDVVNTEAFRDTAASGIDEAPRPEMPPPVSSSSFLAPAQDRVIKTEEDDASDHTSSNLSPPAANNTALHANNHHGNADYKSVLQVQQEALLENSEHPMSIIHCDIDEMPLSAMMLMQPQQNLHAFGTTSASAGQEENANKFEASSLASLLSTAAAADHHHNLLDMSCANTLLTMAGSSGVSATTNTARKRSSNTSSSSSGGGPRPAAGTSSAPTTSSAVKKPGGKRKNYPCRHGCGIIFKTKDEYWLHNRMHIKPDKALQCPECSFITEYKHHLEYHMRNHRAEKPFKCPHPDCNYDCVNKSMLNSHLKSHVDIFLFKCAECTYATKYCHSMKLHLRKYGHKAVPKAPRKSQAAAARRSSSASQRNNALSGGGLGTGDGGDAANFENDDDDDDDGDIGGGGDDDEILTAMDASGSGGENSMLTATMIGTGSNMDEMEAKFNPTQQQLLSQFQQFGNSPIRQQQQQLTVATMQHQQFIMMPSDQQQVTTPQQAFDAGELIRRHQRLSNGSENVPPNQRSSLTSTHTTTSMATGLPSLSVMRNGNLASLLNSVNNNTFANGPQMPHHSHPGGALPQQSPNLSAATNLITNRISLSGGTQLPQSHFGLLPMQQQQQNGQFSSASPIGSQLTNSLANLNALNNTLDQHQHLQQRNNSMTNGGIDHQHGNGGSMAAHADNINGGGLPASSNAIMQLNNPILANALQNVSSKLLHSPPQQQVSMLQQKLPKTSPPNHNNSNNNSNTNGMLYGLMNGNTPTKMLTLQQQLQQAADHAAAQQQQQQQQQLSFMAFGRQNGQPQQHQLMNQQQNDFFQQQQQQQQQMSLLNHMNSESHINGMSSLQQAAVDLLLNGQQTQQPISNNISDLLNNAGLLNRLSASFSQPQHPQQQQHIATSLPNGIGNGGGAPSSLLAALSQLLSSKQCAASHADASISASSTTPTVTTSTQAVTKPSASTINNMMSLQQGFDLTQAINAFATQRQQQQQQQENDRPSISPAIKQQLTAAAIAADAIPHAASFTIHHRAVTENGGTSSSNNTTTSKELPSSSSSSCSGTSATTTSTRRRKRKGPAFKIDSELRKRLAVDMETLDENDEHNNEIDDLNQKSALATAQGRHNIGGAVTENNSGGNITAQCSSSEGGESKHSMSDAGGGEKKELVTRKNMLLAQLRTTQQTVKSANDNDDVQPLPPVHARTPPAAPSSSQPPDAANVWAGSYICTHCGIAFLDLTMYSLHMGNHGLNNPFTCNACGKVTKDKIEFYLHLMCAKRVTAQQFQQQQ